jgi:hypothetical protein
MNLDQIYKDISFVKEKLLEMQKTSSFVEGLIANEEDSTAKMSHYWPEVDKELHDVWETSTYVQNFTQTKIIARNYWFI